MALEKMLAQISTGSITKADLGTLDDEAKIGDEGAKKLAVALSSLNCRLTHLELWNNNIGDEGMKHLSAALTKSPLIHLNLSVNNIGDEGIKEFVLAFKTPDTKLISINFSGNKISNPGIIALSTLIENPNSKIISLNLGTNNFDDEGLSFINSAIKKPICKFVSLDLNNNNGLTFMGEESILNALKANNTIIFFNINSVNKKIICETGSILVRNRKIFNYICHQYLNNQHLRLENKEKLLLQCNYICGEEEKQKSYLEPSFGAKALANAVIKKMKLEHDLSIMDRIYNATIMPAVLARVITDYAKNENSIYELYANTGLTNSNIITSLDKYPEIDAMKAYGYTAQAENKLNEQLKKRKISFEMEKLRIKYHKKTPNFMTEEYLNQSMSIKERAATVLQSSWREYSKRIKEEDNKMALEVGRYELSR